MLTRQISFLLLSLLAFAGSMGLIAYHSNSEAFAPPHSKIRVLRAQNESRSKLTDGEREAFRKRVGQGTNPGQDPAATPQKANRLLDDRIPKHVPIKIKLRKEKEKDFKNPDNEHWIRSFELEVKNTGDKPIYNLSLVFSLPEVKAPDGNPYGFTMNYGRSDLIYFSTALKADDIPIKPGETHVFKIPENLMQGWEDYSQDAAHGRPHATRIEITLNLINFGDGTGFQGPTGVPRKVLRQQSRNDLRSDSVVTKTADPPWRLVAFNDTLTPSPANPLPRGSSLADFLSAEPLSLIPAGASQPPQDCCSGTCSFLKLKMGRCYCSDREHPNVQDQRYAVEASCNDPEGQCGTISTITRSCSYPGIPFPLYCPEIVIVPCGGAPTPSPSPSPSPLPSPSCNPSTKPNDLNCQCVYIEGGEEAGETGWNCSCPQGSFYADGPNFPGNYGCPGNAVYGNNGCCTCIQTNHTCPEGCHWVNELCGCYSAQGPCISAASPSPGQVTGGGGGNEGGHFGDLQGCTDYYWVWFDSYDGGQTWEPSGLVEYAGCW